MTSVHGSQLSTFGFKSTCRLGMFFLLPLLVLPSSGFGLHTIVVIIILVKRMRALLVCDQRVQLL